MDRLRCREASSSIRRTLFSLISVLLSLISAAHGNPDFLQAMPVPTWNSSKKLGFFPGSRHMASANVNILYSDLRKTFSSNGFQVLLNILILALV
jgi:hypothetical protein